MDNQVITIHQPDFMPWLGFFNKISNSDIFVVLDHVINRPNDSNWIKRVKFIINKEPAWITIPVVKPKGIEFQKIMEFAIDVENKYMKKALKTVEYNYKNAPFFDEIFPIIEEYFDSKEILICKRNMIFICTIIERLNINTKIIFSSNLNCEEKGTDLLIEIIKKINGNTYIAGGGAEGYQIDELFLTNNIELQYNNFKHPVYKQLNTNNFFPGLSVVDALMNIGFDKVKNLLDNSIE